ncbi:hypothetical protein [Epilithonimonas hominis]|uniref:hypothetical protein n=1 Tax=Epilithonimonas hominis TaxID=420404 RepID=UPI0028A2306B|nr:hypothetical protein [Epilithonimonas hominis]
MFIHSIVLRAAWLLPVSLCQLTLSRFQTLTRLIIVLDKYREVIADYETEKPLVSNNSFRAE